MPSDLRGKHSSYCMDRHQLSKTIKPNRAQCNLDFHFYYADYITKLFKPQSLSFLEVF